MACEKIKQAARMRNVPIWKIADKYGKAESTMYRLMRHELPPEEEERILSIIDEIAEGEKNEKYDKGRQSADK